MKLQKYALFADIVSGIAIVVTLVILILEVRSNTDAVRAQSISAQRIAENQRRNRVIVNDGGIADLVESGANGDPLSEVDQLRLLVYYIDTLRNWEWQFTEAQADRLPPERLDTQTWRVIWGAEPGLSETFESYRTALDPVFVEFFVESVVNAAPR